MATAGPDVSLQNLMDKFHLSQDQLDQEVSEEHLRKVSRIIDDHVVVGYELGLSESEMTAINHDERTQERQRLAMLMQWKRKVSWNATYGKLLEALLECCRADPAREVCKLLSQKELQPPAKCMKPDRALGSERNGSLTLSSFAAQRFLSEEEVETKVNDFSKRFNKMALDTLDELEKGKVNPKRVILLFNLPSAYLQTRNEHMKFLDTLNAAADLLDLFNILSRYWDHFNYDLLERLIMAPRIDKYIDHERCSQLQRDMKKYVCEMGEFRRQTTIGVYWKIFVKKRKRKKEKVPEDFEELVRNKEEWSEINTLQDVEDFRREVAEEYQLHECLVFFKYILSGSVIIILWIPIVSPLPSIGPQSQGSYTAEEHVNTEGDVSMMRSEESKNMNYPSGLSPSYNRTPQQIPSGFLSEDEVKGKVENFSVRFNKMMVETMDALEKSETSPQRVIVFLTMPSAYLETRDEHMEFLDTLNTAASILELFAALNKYWDHFNYHLLEHLITAPGIEGHINKKKRVQLQKTMKQYVKDLDMFRRQATLGVYCTIFVKQKKEVPKGFKELVTVHEWSKMDTLQKVEDFRQEVARKHKLHDCLVFFKNILFHSVEVIWWIPIVAQHASIGLKLQGSCTAEEHVNTEGEEVQERVEDIKSLRSPIQQKEREIQEMESEKRREFRDIQRVSESLRKEAQSLQNQILQEEGEVTKMEGVIEHFQKELTHMSGPSDYYDILLLGRTGYGKSTTGNKLLGISSEGCGPIRLWSTGKDTVKYFKADDGEVSVTNECKLLSNTHGIRVLDTPGFADTRLVKELGLMEANIQVFRWILQEQRKHNFVFHRVLYFLPHRGALERADGALLEEIKVMYELLGMDIFNIMVIIATYSRKQQMYEFNEEDMQQTAIVFTTAFERIAGQHLPKCPPVIYLPLDEADVLNKVVAAEVISNLPHN